MLSYLLAAHQELIQELKDLENLERAIADQRYHKSSREHWGISAPVRNTLVRKCTKSLSEQELLSLAKKLWETNLFDLMIFAATILSHPKVKPTHELWTIILHFLKSVDGWALEDQLAKSAWKCILADESLLDEVEKWTQSSNFWMRRAALVYTLPFAKPGRNPERMLGWAALYAKDSEWFIQKAIGWWLRILGEHDPKRVIVFLHSQWEYLKGVARKEATRKLSEDWNKHVLQFSKKNSDIKEEK